MANFAQEFDQLSMEIVRSAQEINKILCSAHVDSYLCSTDFEKSLASFQKTNPPTSPTSASTNDKGHRPTSEDVDSLFEALRHRPKQIAKPLQKKASNPQLLKSSDDSLVSTPKKTNEVVESVHKNQRILRSISNEGIKGVDMPVIQEKQKRFAQHLQKTITDYQSVCQVLQKNTANAPKATSTCPVDDEFNEALKKLTETMANVTFIRNNERLSDVAEPPPSVQSPLVACLDEIIEEARLNEQ